MREQIITFFTQFPDTVAVFILAMVPITELRASIPIAIMYYHMHPLLALILSVCGNICAGGLVVFFVEKILYHILQRSQFIEKIWQKYINRIHAKNKDKFERWGSVMLIMFVAIPLPFTGIVTGAVAASIFQIPMRKAMPLLLIGSIISGVIVTLLTIAGKIAL